MTLEELKEKLMMQAFDYDDPKNNYKKFVRLYFNGSAIEFELCDDFLPDQNYYSIALFKSMIAVGKPNGMPVFEFCHAKTPNEEVILIRLKGEKAYAYYDFSHHPFHGKYLSSPM